MLPISIGILGYAAIAKKAIIPAIQSSPYFKLAGISSRSHENKEGIIATYNCKFFDDYRSLIEDSEIDAIYIPLPNSLHFYWSKIAIEHGKHLLVEKSLACSLEEVEELNSLAVNKRVAIVENFQFRFHSQLQIIKKIISDGSLGEIRAMKSSFGFPPFPDSNNIRYQKELGGGALLDTGAYPLRLAAELLSGPLKISSAMLQNNGSAVDIWGGGTVQSKSNGQFLQFSFGFDHFYQCSLEVWGSKGKLFTNRIFTAPPGFEPNITIENQDGIQKMILSQDNHYVNMLNFFYNCTQQESLRITEYKNNHNQACLIDEFLTLSKH
jgi:dTDP-3,4-didehydro-2,6-dideoxy-alpha-D-glucose 3-reductase